MVSREQPNEGWIVIMKIVFGAKYRENNNDRNKGEILKSVQISFLKLKNKMV